MRFSTLAFDGPDVSLDTLWQRARAAFGSVCAPTHRLRITAQVCLHRLDEEDFASPVLRTHIGNILRWIVDADVVEWLVPTPVAGSPCLQTFRDWGLLLHALEVAAIPLPRPPVASDCTIVGTGPHTWCQRVGRVANVVCYDFEECLHALEGGGLPVFMEGPFDRVAFVFCLDTWQGFQCPPALALPARSFGPALALETLLSDLVRFALKLWCKGVPACLLFQSSSACYLAPLPELSGVEFGPAPEGCYLRNICPIWSGFSFVSH